MASELSLQSPVGEVLARRAEPLYQGVNLHGWIDALPYGGQFLPLCVCGTFGPFVLERDDMYELVCERGTVERASAARRALLSSHA